MKRIFSVIICCIIVLLSLTACDGGEGIPFITTQSQTTTVKNTVMVTFPEGFTIIDIADRLAENNVCSKTEFLEICNQPYEGIEIDNADERIYLLEGYIFPDTYEFYFNSDPKTVLDKFISNYNKKITDEIKAKADALGYTIDEILTLASIIQKECDKDLAECAAVSSVFHNRLKSRSFPLLQSDVTTFYITQKLGEQLGYQKDLKLAEQNDTVQKYMSLYSTYYCRGLPAGPICNPGMKAINAAVNPADSDYYYFLTDPSGENFYYASTLSQHQKNGRTAGLF